MSERDETREAVARAIEESIRLRLDWPVGRDPDQGVADTIREIVEDVSRALRVGSRFTVDGVECVLVRKDRLEKAEIALCDLMNTAGHFRATRRSDDREALSAAIKRAAAYTEAAAIEDRAMLRENME